MSSRRANVLCAVGAVVSVTALSAPALAAPDPRPAPGAHDVEGIDRTAKEAYDEGNYAFCKDPSRPLGNRQQALCPLAADLEDCEGYATACNVHQPPPDSSWLERMAEWLAPAAKVLLYGLVLVIVVVVAIPVIRALLKRSRDRKLQEPRNEQSNVGVVVEETPALAEEISDAEAALRLAEEHRARGELKKALGLYLAASLSALDRRGAIRVARHRTNGEYVRACEEAASRAPLREIVREVDKVEFGGAAPTDDALSRVAARAQTIVRTTASAIVVLALSLTVTGCSPPRRGADPAGDELPIAVLERNGFAVRGLGTSLSTMPIPEDDANEGAPVVIVDLEKVPLEDEARAHMMRWVEAGGVLVLFGRVGDWPTELGPKQAAADTRDLVVRAPDPNGGLEDIDSDDDPDAVGVPVEIRGARVARADAFTWKESAGPQVDPLAVLGKDTYAAKRRVGTGIILGVANDDLFTNIGMRPRGNAAALVTLIRSAALDPWRRLPIAADTVDISDIRVARAEDGIPPPANPFAALVAAGLGKGAWHALAAAIVLFLAYGIRQARPRPADKKERRAFAEHVEATGAFYGRTRAHTHALASYGRFVEMRLREIVPRGADPVAFLASRSGVDPARVSELYARAMNAKADDAPRGDELTLIEELRRMLEKALAVGDLRSGSPAPKPSDDSTARTAR